MRMIGGALTIEATREQIELYIAPHDRLGHSCWAVLDRQTGAMTGEAGLVPLGGEGPPIELGYAFGTAFWGRGLATEVGRAIRAEAFGTLVANDGPAECAARARSPSPRSSSPDRSRAGARTRRSHPPPRPAPGSARPHPTAAPAAAPPPWPGRRCRRSAVRALRTARGEQAGPQWLPRMDRSAGARSRKRRARRTLGEGPQRLPPRGALEQCGELAGDRLPDRLRAIGGQHRRALAPDSWQATGSRAADGPSPSCT